MLDNTIGQINAAIEKLDSEISDLLCKRSRLRDKLNEHLSATRSLPSEILSEIFRFSSCIPNLREPQLYSVDLKSILKLGSVCSHWRRVTWSTPYLWTTSLLVSEEINVPPFVVSLSLSNSRKSPVSVGVSLDYLPLEYMRLFQDHHSQIDALRVYIRGEDSTDMWTQLSTNFLLPGDWPNLKELWLCGKGFTPLGLLLQTPNSDALHYTRRENECIPCNVPVNQLTVLRLHCIPIDQCLYLLVHCPCLVEYHCVFPQESSNLYDSSTIIDTSHRPKPINNVKALRWMTHRMVEWSMFFFSSFRFPFLERLLWDGNPLSRPFPDPNPEAMRSIFDTFLPSPARLVVLDWEGQLSSFFSYAVHFAHTNMYSLQRIYITALTSSYLISWVEGLTLTERATANHLPGLRVFHVKIGYLKLGERRVFGAVMRFLCSRRIRPQPSEGTDFVGWNDSPSQEYWRNHTCLERFILDTDEVPFRLEQEQMNALNALIAGGLAFQLVVS